MTQSPARPTVPRPGAAVAGHGASTFIEPGQWVRHPDRPDWGEGQVQSAIGTRVTVNFENAGKVVVNALVVTLQPLDGPGATAAPDADP